MARDLDGWLESTLPRLLVGFLPTQRWFGGKARSIRGIEFEDAAWLAGARRPAALVLVGVGYADGASERYAMLLAFVDELPGLPIVGRLELPGPAVWAVEAATDADTALSLLRGFASPRRLPTLRGGSLRFGDCGEVAALALESALDGRAVRPVGAEQSNTSVRLDRALVLKLFRRLDEGENPELEVGRFLATRTTFRAMPMLRGSLVHMTARGEASTVGVLQDWVENGGDGWGYVIAQLRDPFEVAGGGPLSRDLFALGATTADFHAALAADAATPAFAPEPVTAADLEVWQGALAARVSRTFALVERSIQGWPEDARLLGASLLELRGRAATLGVVPELTPTGGFQKIRVHGDYHLGQTLKTADGFVLIDFEGEPARPLVERRLKHCALKDVAGMFRSFDYAIETVRQQSRNATDETPPRRRLREPFLNGYLSSATEHRAAFLPKDRRALDAWIDFFELEKALSEVDYEINSRPDWVPIPVQGVLRILRGQD